MRNEAWERQLSQYEKRLTQVEELPYDEEDKELAWFNFAFSCFDRIVFAIGTPVFIGFYYYFFIETVNRIYLSWSTNEPIYNFTTPILMHTVEVTTATYQFYNYFYGPYIGTVFICAVVMLLSPSGIFNMDGYRIHLIRFDPSKFSQRNFRDDHLLHFYIFFINMFVFPSFLACSFYLVGQHSIVILVVSVGVGIMLSFLILAADWMLDLVRQYTELSDAHRFAVRKMKQIRKKEEEEEAGGEEEGAGAGGEEEEEEEELPFDFVDVPAGRILILVWMLTFIFMLYSFIYPISVLVWTPGAYVPGPIVWSIGYLMFVIGVQLLNALLSMAMVVFHRVYETSERPFHGTMTLQCKIHMCTPLIIILLLTLILEYSMVVRNYILVETPGNDAVVL